MRTLRDVLRAARQGDLSVRLPTNGDGSVFGEVALAFNALIAQNEALVAELDRVSRRAGAEGQITDRASLGPVAGAWSAAIGSLNSLVESMAFPQMEAARLLERVAAGDLSREMPRDYRTSYATPEARHQMTAIHAALVARGVLLTPNCSGALSTPMGEAEMALLSTALVAAVSEVLSAR